MIYKIFLTLKKMFRSVQNLGILIGNTSTLNYFRPKEILMRISKTAIAVSVLSLFAAAMVPATSMAAGGASGAAVKYAKQGQIGEVITNPYKIAPLTAIIRSGGYALSDVSVRIVPKPNGSEIKYDVDRSEVLTHGGIPVFGLYPDYVNTVEVSYTRTDLKGEQKKISESYQIYAPPVYTEPELRVTCSTFRIAAVVQKVGAIQNSADARQEYCS